MDLGNTKLLSTTLTPDLSLDRRLVLAKKYEAGSGNMKPTGHWQGGAIACAWGCACLQFQ